MQIEAMKQTLAALKAGEMAGYRFVKSDRDTATISASEMKAWLELEIPRLEAKISHDLESVAATSLQTEKTKPEAPCVAADFNQDSADQACKLISECQQRGLGLEVATAALKSGLSDMDAAIRSGQEALAMDAMDRAAEATAAKLNGAPAL